MRTEPQTESAPDRPAAFLVARAGHLALAFPVPTVREVRQPMPLSHVSGAPSFVDGVFRIRKMLVPVVDVRRRLGIALSSATGRERIVLVVMGGLVLGLVVDAVVRVVHERVVDTSESTSDPVILGDTPVSKRIQFRATSDAAPESAVVVSPPELLSAAERAELLAHLLVAAAPGAER